MPANRNAPIPKHTPTAMSCRRSEPWAPARRGLLRLFRSGRTPNRMINTPVILLGLRLLMPAILSYTNADVVIGGLAQPCSPRPLSRGRVPHASRFSKHGHDAAAIKRFRFSRASHLRLWEEEEPLVSSIRMPSLRKSRRLGQSLRKGLGNKMARVGQPPRSLSSE
jgi:hypothetical protein